MFLSESWYPHGGGAEFASYLYAKLLSKAGHRIIVITSRFPGEPEISEERNLVIYRRFFSKSAYVKFSILTRFDVLFSTFLKKAIRWADVVYIPGFWFSAIPVAKLYGKPVVVHLHGYINLCPLAHLYDHTANAICERAYNHKRCAPGCIYLFEKNTSKGLTGVLGSVFFNSTFRRCLDLLVNSSDAVICVSKAQRDIIVRYDPSLMTKTHLVYNPSPELSEMRIEGDGFGYFGGLDYLKGYSVLHQAMMLLAARSAGKYKIYATAFPKEKTVTAGNLDIFYYKRLDVEGCKEIYRKIKAVVVPSLGAEVFAYVVSEALLRGRVVLASKVGGIPERIKGCKGVFLFDAGDHQKLAELLEEINSLDRETIADLGSQNREAFMKNFSNAKTINDFVNVCTELLSKRKLASSDGD